MTNPIKLAKLKDKVEHFAMRLEEIKDFTVHQHVNQFYYMQKVTELVVLQEQIDATQSRLSCLASCIENEYGCILRQWSKDVRWLNGYERTRSGPSFYRYDESC